MKDYTPSPAFDPAPVQVPANNDNIGLISFWDPLFADVYDRLFYLDEQQTETNNIADNHQIKTGFTVTGVGDNQPFDFSNARTPFVVAGQISAKDAIINLDDNAKTENTRVTNLNGWVGGGVSGGSPTYSSTTYVDNGDSLVTAVGKLDSSLGGVSGSVGSNTSNIGINATNISTNSGDISTLQTDVGNVFTDDQGVNYENFLALQDNKSVKQNMQFIDEYILGMREQEKLIRQEQGVAWQNGIAGAYEELYHAFFYSESDDGYNQGISTGTFNEEQTTYSGTAGQVLYLAGAFSADIDRVVVRVAGENLGNIVFKLNLINSTADVNMETIAAYDTEQVLVSNGQQLVIKVEFTGAATLRDVRVAGKQV